MAKPSEAASHKQKNTLITVSRVGRRGRRARRALQPALLEDEGAARHAEGSCLVAEVEAERRLHGPADGEARLATFPQPRAKVAAGITTVGEVLRVTSDEDPA